MLVELVPCKLFVVVVVTDENQELLQGGCKESRCADLSSASSHALRVPSDDPQFPRSPDSAMTHAREFDPGPRVGIGVVGAGRIDPESQSSSLSLGVEELGPTG